jgi:ABC-type lipoprotein export system ATPase subunit
MWFKEHFDGISRGAKVIIYYLCIMLYAENLTYSYDAQHTLRFPDIRCDAGAHWLLLGQSGSGKTTLLHLLGGLLTPAGGTVKVADTLLSGISSASLDHFRGRNIGIIFQQAHFVAALTVEENLLLAQQLAGMKPDRQRVGSLLEHLGLGHKRKSKTDRLSQGEQQRVAIARAIINRPGLILADEPTSALDDQRCAEVISLLEREAGEVGATLLIVTHDGRLKDHFSNRISL